MVWLGPQRGFLIDWSTQLWVRLTGRIVDLKKAPWLSGPTAPTIGIHNGYFESLADDEGLSVLSSNGVAGIVPNFSSLAGNKFDPTVVSVEVVQFYERTSEYELDAWAEWCGLFRPFGRALAVLFSRRLQQLNVPLSGLDTSKGMSSEVLQLGNPSTRTVSLVAWYRRLRSSGNVLYAGFYSICTLPNVDDPCVKVVFPLPNGNAIVILKTHTETDGSFVITSAGSKFGDPGFYFTVRKNGNTVWARYVRALQESIHVYPSDDGVVRADHVLTYFGLTFLRLHYRMRRKPAF